MKTYEFHWYINDKEPLLEQFGKNQQAVVILSALARLIKKKAIKIDLAESESTSTHTFLVWKVVKPRLYERARKKYGLPDGKERVDDVE